MMRGVQILDETKAMFTKDLEGVHDFFVLEVFSDFVLDKKNCPWYFFFGGDFALHTPTEAAFLDHACFWMEDTSLTG